jgi:uncharacterized protein (DUF433 family)
LKPPPLAGKAYFQGFATLERLNSYLLFAGGVTMLGDMSKDYIEQRESACYVVGTRISLDSIVYAFRRGDSPETICQNFELLTLEQVYGAIAYYLMIFDVSGLPRGVYFIKVNDVSVQRFFKE